MLFICHFLPSKFSTLCTPLKVQDDLFQVSCLQIREITPSGLYNVFFMRLTSFMWLVFWSLYIIYSINHCTLTFLFFFFAVFWWKMLVITQWCWPLQEKKVRKSCKMFVTQAWSWDSWQHGCRLLAIKFRLNITHQTHIPPHIHSLYQKSQDKNSNLHGTDDSLK